MAGDTAFDKTWSSFMSGFQIKKSKIKKNEKKNNYYQGKTDIYDGNEIIKKLKKQKRKKSRKKNI